MFSTGGLIAIYYLIYLGHLPDWYAFLDYSLAYSNGFGALPIDPRGGVWLLVMLWCSLATTAVAFWQRRQTVPALLVGTAGAAWVVSSYFVSRSHANNITNIIHVVCTSMAIMLYVFNHYSLATRWATVVKTSFVAVLTVVLTAVFVNPRAK